VDVQLFCMSSLAYYTGTNTAAGPEHCPVCLSKVSWLAMFKKMEAQFKLCSRATKSCNDPADMIMHELSSLLSKSLFLDLLQFLTDTGVLYYSVDSFYM